MQMVGTQLLLHHLANKEKVTLQSAVTSPCTSRAGCMASVTESPKDRIPHHTRKEPEESEDKTFDLGKGSFLNKLLAKVRNGCLEDLPEDRASCVPAA